MRNLRRKIVSAMLIIITVSLSVLPMDIKAAPTTKEESGVITTITKEKEYYRGIDISEWQGEIDWATLKENDIDFVMMRIACGTRKDKYFDYNAEQAMKYGIKMGGYVYTCAESVMDVITEAKTCLDYIKDYHFDYPICFDYETSSMKSIFKKDLNSRMAYVFCKTIEKAGYNTAIYGSTSYFDKYYDMEFIEGIDIWVAGYPTDDSYFFKNWDWDGFNKERPDIPGTTMWQFTERGKIDGIEGFVDTNICWKDYHMHDTEKIEVNSQAVRGVCERCFECGEIVDSILVNQITGEIITLR